MTNTKEIMKKRKKQRGIALLIAIFALLELAVGVFARQRAQVGRVLGQATTARARRPSR